MSASSSSTAGKLVIANWKSNCNWAQAVEWLETFAAQREHNHHYVICPPFPILGALQSSGIELGVQDLSPFEAGAYTGAVSATNLVGLGVTHVILGHSERRKYFGENSDLVAQKVELALAHELTPVICVDRDQFEEQAEALQGLTTKQRQNIVIAYEPVHSISTFGGQEDPLEKTLQAVAQAQEVFKVDRVIYGGSVNAENSLTYLRQKSIAGVLVGGASLKPEVFAAL